MALFDFVQSAHSTAPDTFNPLSVSSTFASTVTAGNIVIAFFSVYDAPNPAPGGVTDSQGNTYSLGSVASNTAGIYYAVNVTGGSVTVTGASPGLHSYGNLSILEFVGDATVSFDASVGANAVAATYDSGAITTVSAVELLIGAVDIYNGTATVASGYTSRVAFFDGFLLSPLVASQVTSASGSYSFTGAHSGNVYWANILALKSSGGGSAYVGRQPLLGVN